METLVAVTFQFPQDLVPQARRVAVVGQFNRWDPEANALAIASEGDWSTKIHLPPGSIVYGFDVDGTFWLDPNDEGRVPNGWGSEYSTRLIRPPVSRPRWQSSALVTVQGRRE